MSKAILAIIVAIVSTGCISKSPDSVAQNQARPSPTEAMYAKYDHRFFPATTKGGAPVKELTPEQRRVVAKIQSVIKPSLRSSLQYTYSGLGVFVLALKQDQFAINFCHTPTDSTKCRHDCGIVMNPQTWDTATMMDFGRCQDDAPVWLDPKAPLPPFD